MISYSNEEIKSFPRMLSLLMSNPILFVAYGVALLVAITIHEYAHAWTADHLGDPTPRLQKRITLNPLAHIDLYGLLFLLVVGFGWGKPVQFDPYNLKNPRRDAAIISVAGPLSNFALALVASLLLRLLIVVSPPLASTLGLLVFAPLITLNVVLGVFNLLPIHPLDGFKIVGGILPREQAQKWYELERYGIIFLLVLIVPFFGGLSMIDFFVRPVTTFFLQFFLPSSGFIGGKI